MVAEAEAAKHFGHEVGNPEPPRRTMEPTSSSTLLQLLELRASHLKNGTDFQFHPATTFGAFALPISTMELTSSSRVQLYYCNAIGRIPHPFLPRLSLGVSRMITTLFELRKLF